MYIPTLNVLQEKAKLVRTVRDLCEEVSKIESGQGPSEEDEYIYS